MDDIASEIQLLEDGKRRATKWLLQHVNPDGSLGDVNRGVFYFRAPWSFAIAGESLAGLRLIDWIRKNMFSPEGDFAGKYPQGEIFAERWATYPLSCLIYGAHMLRQFDISSRGMRFLLSYRDPATGGYFNRRDRKGEDGEQELFPTCQAGLACLITGDLEEARLAARFVELLWDLQPDRKNRFYMVYRRDQGLVTEFPPDDQMTYVLKTQEPGQGYSNLGIAVPFLVRLYMATNQEQYLELAITFMEYSMSCTEKQFEWLTVGKTGWGSSLLYQMTREPKYLEWTRRVAKVFLRMQEDDGHWHHLDSFDPLHQTHVNILVTSEEMVHLDHFIGGLATATS